MAKILQAGSVHVEFTAEEFTYLVNVMGSMTGRQTSSALCLEEYSPERCAALNDSIYRGITSGP